MPSLSPLALTWQPAAPPLHIVGTAVLLAAAAIAAYARAIRTHPLGGGVLLAMRLAMIGAIAVILMGPSAVRTTSHTRARPPLSVLLDTSESMRTADERGVCRIDAARNEWLDDDTLAHLSRDFELTLLGFDSERRPLPRAHLGKPAGELATGRVTNLADSVAAAVADMPRGRDGAALLVISDGRDSRDAPIASAAELARSRDLPVFAALVGRDSVVADAAVVAIPMQDYLLPGESGAILVKAHQSGFGGATATVRVEHAGKSQTFPVSFQGKPVVELQVPVKHDEPGQHEHTVTIEPLEGESTDSNNATTVFCDVQRKRLRVLVVEGSPYWDTKFLAQSLRKDERIELVQISQLSKSKRETIVTRNEGNAPAVPRTADEWSQYDVVILGKNIREALSDDALDHLVEYVSERGGHLVYARGEYLTSGGASPRPAADGAETARVARRRTLEPVEEGDAPLIDTRLALAPAGRLSPWLSASKMGVNIDQALGRLPGLESAPANLREKPAAVVLVRAVPSGAAGGGAEGAVGPPAIVSMNVGRGSVLAITGDGLWRWSLLNDEQQDLVGLYDAFWSNMIRWLTMGGDFPPGQQVSLKLARTTARLGDLLPVDVVCKHLPTGGEPPKLTIVDPTGRASEKLLERRPGREPRFQVSLEPNLTGVHRVVLKSPGLSPPEQEARFSVYDVNEERLHTLVNPLTLKTLAEQTRGEFFEAGDRDRFLQKLARHVRTMQAPPRAEYVWDDGRWMTLLLVWAGVEWLARRRLGLL